MRQVAAAINLVARVPLLAVVSHPSGAVMPAASLTATDIATGVKTTVTTDSRGLEINSGTFEVVTRARGPRVIMMQIGAKFPS
jgi:hypothetical protein